MEFACAHFVPVGVLCPVHAHGAFTVTVKLSYDVAEQGWARVARNPDAILDWAGATPHFPPDIIGAKAACDVALVGRAIDEPGAIQFGVGQHVWSRDNGRVAAAFPGLPGDSALAPAEQRIPFPRLPLHVSFEGRAHRMKATLPAPAPAIGIVQPSRGPALQELSPSLDAVLLDPARALVIVTFRARFLFDGDPHRDLILALSFDDPPWSPVMLTQWPRFPCPVAIDDDPNAASPGQQPDEETTSTSFVIPQASLAALPFARADRVPPAHAPAALADFESVTTDPADDTLRMKGGAASAPAAALPFAVAPLLDEETRVGFALPRGPALPFGAVDLPLPPAEPPFARPSDTLSDAETPRESADLGWYPAVNPGYVEAPPPAPLPPAPLPPAPLPPAPLPPVAMVAPSPFGAFTPAVSAEPPPFFPTAPLSPVAVAAPIRAPAPGAGLSAAELEALRADLQAFPDRRRAILADHGTSEAEWLAIERQLADKRAGDAHPMGALGAAAALMRNAARKPPKHWRKS